MAVITGKARRRGEAGRAASGDREAGMREETRTGGEKSFCLKKCVNKSDGREKNGL